MSRVLLAIPEEAVQTFEGGNAVFVAKPGSPGTFVARPVEIGAIHNQMTSVLQGLSAGDPVVVAGAFVIKAELGKAVMEGKSCSGH